MKRASNHHIRMRRKMQPALEFASVLKRTTQYILVSKLTRFHKVVIDVLVVRWDL